MSTDSASEHNKFILETESQIRSHFKKPERELRRYLEKTFAKISDARCNITFRSIFLRCLIERFGEASKADPPEPGDSDQTESGWDGFAKACAHGGLAMKSLLETFKHEEVTDLREEDSREMTVPFMIMKVFELLLSSGDPDERIVLHVTLLGNGYVGLLLHNLQRGPLVSQLIASQRLESLAKDAFLFNKMDPSTAALILEPLFLCALRDPKACSGQLGKPCVHWQRQLDHELEDIGLWDRNEDTRRCMATRLFGRVQEQVIKAPLKLLTMPPLPPPDFRLAVVKCKPIILDLLLDCTLLERPRYYPESNVVYLACSTIVSLLDHSSYIIPGISIPVDRAFPSRDSRSISQALQILTSRHEWSERIIDAYSNLEDEGDITVIPEDIRNLDDILPHEAEREKRIHQSLVKKPDTRAKSRFCLLRLISIITHTADVCGVRNVQVESFLRVGYKAMSKVEHTEGQRGQNVPALPPSQGTGKDVIDEETGTILPPSETFLGAITLMRLLVVLAQRNALDSIQLLRSPPDGLSSLTSLNHIQQITHPDIIHRTINIALVRSWDQLDIGNKIASSLRSTLASSCACRAYRNAAELAATIVALDNHTGGRYATETTGSRRLLAGALGNAAHTWIYLDRWKEAYFCALAAVEAAEDPFVAQALGQNVVEKNKLRLQEAKDGLDTYGDLKYRHVLR
ncbi:hypothetical protein CONPUDRAFT_160045 [Coniophora puteana RWD-64-598 SS2]|uniref:Uncharacterized protein n=1 Tax=Coniophora puteana (strain RWD-64-598) TaxID=741705 RepID=R7SEP2_CONPW|nr:uncharacterized protein CONPUDRAFT_160045 [Coniophora puteana RWD-64-598 SS2]EIW74335.1 hypothetical protein CONPUDRAFT_160045 [Coniophora puteana RWD-64-598 SS2]